MIASKYINAITAVLVCICLIGCGFIVYAAGANDTEKITEYQKRLFGDIVIELELRVNEDDWQDLLRNAQSKEWIAGDLIINGEEFSTVGIRTKGNSSLSMSGQRITSENARYSLQFKFNKYVKGQTYYGLDTFCINNMMGDATYMKDYLAYDIMKFIGVATPLVNYANVRVNGEDYGFCLALERYDSAFLDRVYNTTAGELYNVKIGMGRRGDFEDMWQDVENNLPGAWRPDNGDSDRQLPGGAVRPDFSQDDIPDFSQGGFPDFSQSDGADGGGRGGRGGPAGVQQSDGADGGGWGGRGGPAGIQQSDGADGGELPDFSQGGGFNGGGLPDITQGGGFNGGGFNNRGIGGFGGGNGGGSLVYTSDDPADYSAIFDNSISSVSDKDKQRVITALEHLSTGTDLEQYFDVDEILRYFAAHTVVVNLDSYTSNMAQNYYIYERDGKISILPWDYGLTFGGFQSSSASSVVNFPIDTPVSGVSMEDRPLLNVLLAVDEYREMYHDYLNQIVTGYFNSGLFEQTIDRLDAKIGGYVMNDVSAYYTYEQYQSSLPILKELGRLRAESIAGQLDGSIPSTSAGQNADSSSLVDASSINLSVLGSMMGGGGVGGGGVGGGRQRR